MAALRVKARVIYPKGGGGGMYIIPGFWEGAGQIRLATAT